MNYCAPTQYTTQRLAEINTVKVAFGKLTVSQFFCGCLQDTQMNTFYTATSF